MGEVDAGTIDEVEPPAAGVALAAVTSIRKLGMALGMALAAVTSIPKLLPLLAMALLAMALLAMGDGPVRARPEGKGPSQAPS
jgi:hypothetical protein